MSTIRAFNFSVDLLQNILWQYDSAPALRALVEEKEAWYTENHTDFWNDWYVDVFDLSTANDFGLSVWAIILGIPLVVVPAPDPGKVAFGFGINRANFNNGNFAPTSNSFGLTTEQKRLVLKLRYFQLITRGAAPEINAFLNHVFGPGVVYVADGLQMNARYVFADEIPSALQLVFEAYDILPRPAAVGVDWVSNNPLAGFGFGRYRKNFNNGNFYNA